MVDEKATRDKVNELLSKYHNIRRLAGQPIFSSLDCAMNCEIQLTKNKRLTTDILERKNKFENLLNDMHYALSLMPNKHANLLFKMYMADSIISNRELYNKMNISKNTFYKQKNKALIYFSESFQGGRLITIYEN